LRSRRNRHSQIPTKKKVGPRLSRDIRRDILLLRDLNDDDDEVEYTYERIATILSHRHGRKVTIRAVQYTVNSHKATPKRKDAGESRQATYLQLGELFDVSPNAVNYALQKRGYSRRVAIRKPRISEKTRLERLA